MGKTHDYQRLFRQFKEEQGKDAVALDEVIDWAIRRRYLEEPKPVNPRAKLADEFAKALRDEYRQDGATGRSYRVNHAVTESIQGKLHAKWGDIDEQPRGFMQKSFTQRRQQIVGDCAQLTFDCDHFNRTHPSEEPIVVPLDFTEDVAERKFAAGLPGDEAA